MSPCFISVHPLLCWYVLVAFVDVCCYVLMVFIDPHCCGQLVLVKTFCCALLVFIKALRYILLVLISAHWHFLVFYWCSLALLGVLLMLVDTPWCFTGVRQHSLLWSIGVCQTHWHFRCVLFVFIRVPCWNLLSIGAHWHIGTFHCVLLMFIGVPCWSLLVFINTSMLVIMFC